MIIKPVRVERSANKVYDVLDAHEDMIAQSHDETIAQDIAAAINDFHYPSERTREQRLTKMGNVMLSVEDAIRRTRNMYRDLTLDGVSIYSNYSACVRHNVGKCPEYHVSMNLPREQQCQYELQSLVLSFPNGSKFKLELHRLLEDSSAVDDRNGNENAKVN